MAGRVGLLADYRFVGEALASGGAIAVIPDYRLVPQVHYPESQPILYASNKAPRTLLLAAASDSLVNPQRNTLGLAARL